MLWKIDVPGHLTRFRLLGLLVIVVLLAPAAVSGVTHYLTADASGVSPTQNETATNESTTRNKIQNITFVSTQGKETRVGSRLVALNTATKQPLWTHTRFCRYYDVDPLNQSTLLVSADTAGCLDGKGFEALIIDWRNNTVLNRFPLPPDTHDVDFLGNGEYAVADKKHDRAYIYNQSVDRITWQYRFKPHFPRSAGGGPDRYAGDYTHLNDIDSINNGSSFLVSPRNFDRVMAIKRSSKQLQWVLGGENNKEILYEQHNPVLLSRDPLTVLVADSENDRVVEYTRTQNEWRQTWVYSQNLGWPRDADRLPNGNTLIVDTQGQRVLEVTPEKEIVWQTPIDGFAPYDIERLQSGDEPAGPPTIVLEEWNESVEPNNTTETDTSNSSGATPSGAKPGPENGLGERLVEVYNEGYMTAQWVVPSWVGHVEFWLAVLAIVVALGWLAIEAISAVRRRTTRHTL